MSAVWMTPLLLPPPRGKAATRHFTHRNLHFSKINISCNCEEKNFEISAIELEKKLIILSL